MPRPNSSLIPGGPIRRALRSRGARAAGVVAVLGIALSACFPPPPPPPPPQPTQDCIADAPNTAAEYTQLFQKRSTAWEAADTTSVVNRPGRSTAWFFGDTMLGRAQPNGAADPAGGFANSSAMTESGGCITPVLDSGGPYFANPGDGTWYWPAGSLARPDGSVDVVLSRVRRITATPPFDFAAAGVAIAHVRADMSVESITPVSTAAVTGTDTNGAPELRTYGNSVTSDGQYAYLYAFVTGYPFRLDQYVARVPMNAPLTGPWQYSSCKVEPTFGQQCPAGQRDWSNDPNAARPMDVGGDPSVGVNGPPIAAFHVVSYGGQYLAVAKAVDLPSSNAADHKVLAWRSTTPMGPWVPVGVLGTATPATASGAFTYVAQVLATPSARWVLTWNSNADSAAVNADVRLYGPRFATPANLP